VVLRAVLRRGFAVLALRVRGAAFLAFGVAMNYLRCVGRQVNGRCVYTSGSAQYI
jgi:hypothetical protein